MGMGTLWQLAQRDEARLQFEGRLPNRKPEIDVKFITSIEMQWLRGLLHGRTEYDPKIKVYEMIFPRANDPEYEAWYANIEEEFDRAVECVVPEFLAELRAIDAATITTLGATWGKACGDWWHERWPEHAPWALGEFVRMAHAAHEQGLAVFVRNYL